MKLVIIIALIAFCAAGRLEHLERSYLPPDNTNNLGFGSNTGGQENLGSFDSQHGASHGSFGSASPARGNNFGSNGGSNGNFGLNGGARAPSGQPAQRPSQFQNGQNSHSQFDPSNQYPTPKQSSNFQNIPQQSFDEQTGYHY
ncbi:unnamed protein product [Parnassius apollo]|uniref:(apollo) hypothetical protein n=1 Tax=Parnassius apollo TaxID=110799 RepID=A0A8S3XBJ1_PARAO|nr:unnamed protein product [Parnassius apollo]